MRWKLLFIGLYKEYMRTLGKHRDSIRILWGIHVGFYRRDFEKTLHPQGVQSCGKKAKCGTNKPLHSTYSTENSNLQILPFTCVSSPSEINMQQALHVPLEGLIGAPVLDSCHIATCLQNLLVYSLQPTLDSPSTLYIP